MEKTIRMELEKETKGALRYHEMTAEGHPATVEQSLIGTLYLRKSAMGGESPTAIDVTVRTV